MTSEDYWAEKMSLINSAIHFDSELRVQRRNNGHHLPYKSTVNEDWLTKLGVASALLSFRRLEQLCLNIYDVRLYMDSIRNDRKGSTASYIFLIASIYTLMDRNRDLTDVPASSEDTPREQYMVGVFPSHVYIVMSDDGDTRTIYSIEYDEQGAIEYADYLAAKTKDDYYTYEWVLGTRIDFGDLNKEPVHTSEPPRIDRTKGIVFGPTFEQWRKAKYAGGDSDLFFEDEQ